MCLIPTLPNQKLINSLILGLFENFENRLAGLNRVLSVFSVMADQADPNFGFRQ